MVVKGRQSGSDNPNNFYGSVVTDFAAIMVCTSDWTNGKKTKDVGRKLMCLVEPQVEWNYKPNVSSILRTDQKNKNVILPYIYSFL